MLVLNDREDSNELGKAFLVDNGNCRQRHEVSLSEILSSVSLSSSTAMASDSALAAYYYAYSHSNISASSSSYNLKPEHFIYERLKCLHHMLTVLVTVYRFTQLGQSFVLASP